MSVDLAGFYNSYDDLLSAEPGVPYLAESDQGFHLLAPLVAGNKAGGATWGSEVLAEWRPTSAFKMSSAYTFLRMDIDRDADSLDSTSSDPQGASPRHRLTVRSMFDLSRTVQQDVIWRYVGALDGLGVPSYASLDARLGWAITPKWNLAIAGQNLTNNKHLEFRPDFIATTPTLVRRTVQVTARVTF